MTKKEFLIRLKRALGNDLSGAVVQENVEYYSSYIDDEIGKGRSEARSRQREKCMCLDLTPGGRSCS